MAQARALAKACRPAPNRGRTAHDPHPGRQSHRAQRLGHEADARVLHRRARAAPPRPLPDARRAGGLACLPRHGGRADAVVHPVRGAAREARGRDSSRGPREPLGGRHHAPPGAPGARRGGRGRAPRPGEAGRHPRLPPLRPRLLHLHLLQGARRRAARGDLPDAPARRRGARRGDLPRARHLGRGARRHDAMTARLRFPHEYVALDPAVRREIVDCFAADGLPTGAGILLLARLDPSVIDEASPTAVNPRLDMYDPRNGYRPMAEGPSRYAPDFLAEFRAAQRARCERIDRQALTWCEEAAYFRTKLRSDGARMAPAERALVTRLALQRRYLLVYRTLADPRYLDPSLEPSPRPLGSIFSYGRDPIHGNYGEGLGRVMSARGWLSTWSGLQSNAALERTLPEVRVPTLVIAALADTDIYPPECRRAFEASAARDKVYADLAGADHYLRPAGADGAKLGDPKDRVADELILPWLGER